VSPARELRCTGAPRDLGFDQGRAAADVVRDALHAASGLRRGMSALLSNPDERTRRVERDLSRYFPHMAERAAGLARGAGVPRAALAAALARELDGSAGSGVAISGERTGAGSLLGRGLGGEASHGWVRFSQPESDFRSLEWVVPWRIPAVAGVNEHGLAVTATSLPTPSYDFGICAAPAALLVQDCLQRFSTLEAAVEWCQRRPAGGCASLLLADASGQAASVIVAGRERTVTRGEGGVIVGVGPEARAASLRKACSGPELLDVRELAALLEESEGPGPCLVLDPAGRRMALVRDEALRFFDLEAGPVVGSQSAGAAGVGAETGGAP